MAQTVFLPTLADASIQSSAAFEFRCSPFWLDTSYFSVSWVFCVERHLSFLVFCIHSFSQAFFLWTTPVCRRVFFFFFLVSDFFFFFVFSSFFFFSPGDHNRIPDFGSLPPRRILCPSRRIPK